VVALACITILRHPQIVDFYSFWAAGQLGAKAYSVSGPGHLLPIPHPPPLLFFTAALRGIPYPTAFVAWVMFTGLFYALASGRNALAHPSVVYAGIIGQLSFVTTGLFRLGLRGNPILAGVAFGCLVIKPQLAILAPVALVAGGHWKTLAVAGLTAVGLFGASLLVFGGFWPWLAVLEMFGARLRQGAWPWHELASTYGLLRDIGLSDAPAMFCHCIIAVGAAVVVFVAWRHDWSAKGQILSAATVLASPYLFTYDALLLPITSWPIGILCSIPVLAVLFHFSAPNTIPLAALISILGVMPTLRTPKSRPLPAGFATH
jgi:hypothetical protein